MAASEEQKSWWTKIFGRSLYGLVFGKNLADRNVAATFIGIMLVATLCYLAAFKGHNELITPLVNVVFVVVGFYFGAKRETGTDDEEG
jgi:hypothetical protein